MKQFSLNEYLKNPSKKIVTRLGKSVMIACSSKKGDFPIIAEVQGSTSYKIFTDKGKFMSVGDSNYDLFFAPEKHEGWVNLYKNSEGFLLPSRIYQTKEVAKKRGSWHDCYVTTTKIEWEE